MTRSKIFKSTALYGILNFLPLGSRFLLFPIFVNFLTPNDFGIIGLHASVVNFMTILISFGMDSSYTRFYFDYESDRKKTRDFLSTTFILVLFSGLCIGALLAFFGDAVFSMVFTDGEYPFFPYGVYAYTFGLIISLNAIILIHLRNEEKPVSYFLFSVSVFMLMIGLECFVVFGESPSAENVLLARIIGLLLPSIIMWIITFRNSFGFRSSLLKGTFKYAYPVFIYTLLGFTYLYFDRILVSNMLTVEKLSIYTTALMVASVLELSLQAIDLAITPSLFRYYKKNEFTSARNLLNSVGSFVYLLSALILLCSPFFIIRFTPEFYEPAVNLIPVFIVGYVFRFLFGAINKELYFFKKVKKIPIINFGAGLALILSSLFLIPIYGLLGAAWAMVISRFSTVVLSIFVLHKELKQPFRFSRIYLSALLIILLLTIPMLGSNLVVEYGGHYLASIMIVFFLIVSERNKIRLKV